MLVGEGNVDSVRLVESDFVKSEMIINMIATKSSKAIPMRRNRKRRLF